MPRLNESAAWRWSGALAAALALGAPANAQELPAGLRPGEHTVTVNGARVWYRVAGRAPAGAPPVVFIPGGPGGNSYDFAAVPGPRLERALRMVYFDPRGTGRSERPAGGDYAMSTLVNDVEALRKALGVPRIALIGHSFGATVALEYAAKYTERVSRLVYVDGLWDAPGQCRFRRERLIREYPALRERVLADTLAADGTRRGDCELEFRVLAGPEREAFNDRGLFRDSAARMRHDSINRASGLRNTGEMSRALFRAGLLSYRFAHAARLTMPVRVIVGRFDGQGGMEPQRELARLLPDARFVELAESGHFPYLDEPERFAREVIAFLTAPPRER
jgi:proline iminopeptidase